MQGQHLFEYAVIRVMPRVDREEFLNVGIVLYCASRKFLQVRYDESLGRLHALVSTDGINEVAASLQSFQRICKGGKEGGTIGALPIAERFRWLTATRSTVVQTSKVHPGFCDDPAVTLDKIYEQMVMPVTVMG